jgi:N-acetyl-1-D-myo-inositol-2-amino-2-deoxy-alpha-D-glucopyranoside deacetylase
MAGPGKLLAIYAHPDDEASTAAGTFAAFADRGGQVTLICATRGEVGEISDPALATPETLGSVREGELISAMSHVGVTDVRFLDYRDSGMAGTAENDDPRAFVQADDAEVVGRLLEIMREIDPDIVLTFGEDGVYGHPDHLKIHRDATAAVRAFANESGDSGPALYYTAIPRERIQAMAQRNPGAFVQMTPEEIANLGTPSELITTEIDVSDQYDRKRAALFSHVTQISPQGPWRELPPETIREYMSVERFRLVKGAGNDTRVDPLLEALGTSPERDRRAV